MKQRMQTYDLAYAGPRNRYTVLTDAGPIIVHNCGYGLGWANFARQLLAGFLGAPPIRYDMEFAKQLGVSQLEFERFTSEGWLMEKLADIPHTCTDEELLVHAVCAKYIIDKYRATSQPVVDFWAMCDRMLPLMADPQNGSLEYKNICFSSGGIDLPNGMRIRYPDLKLSRTTIPDRKGKYRVQWTYSDGKTFTTLYGGKITENIVQAVARIVMTDAMLRINKRYRPVLTVHDEVAVLAPEAEAEEALQFLIDCLTVEPSWMPGIPLAAEGSFAVRYGDAK